MGVLNTGATTNQSEPDLEKEETDNKAPGNHLWMRLLSVVAAAVAANGKLPHMPTSKNTKMLGSS